jgi:hypothetical protein
MCWQWLLFGRQWCWRYINLAKVLRSRGVNNGIVEPDRGDATWWRCKQTEATRGWCARV